MPHWPLLCSSSALALPAHSTEHGSPVNATARRQCIVYDLHDQLVPYEKAWQWQRKQLARAIQEIDAGLPAQERKDAVFILQHPPTYTLGAGSTLSNLKFDPENPPAPLFRTERGGEITYHGPGQLVMYPILDLNQHQPDLHWYLRQLEAVISDALMQVSGLEAHTCPGLTGVWVEGKKVAAIGIRAKKWVTYHGTALNLTTDLAPFSLIVPCGIADKPVTSVAQLTGELHLQGGLQAPHVCGDVQAHASSTSVDGNGSSRGGDVSVGVDASSLLLEYRWGLLEAFSEQFGVDLVPGDVRELDE